MKYYALGILIVTKGSILRSKDQPNNIADTLRTHSSRRQGGMRVRRSSLMTLGGQIETNTDGRVQAKNGKPAWVILGSELKTERRA